MRGLAIAAAILTILSLVLNNLLYLPGLLIGAVAVIIYRRAKPSDVRPYYYVALAATILALGIFFVQGVLGFFFFIQS